MLQNNLNEIDIAGYKTPLREGKTRGMYYFFTQTCNTLPDYTSLTKSLDIPTAVIWGKEDTFLRIEPQKTQLQSSLNIKEENIHLLEAKHFIQEEKPEEIVTIISAFLKE